MLASALLYEIPLKLHLTQKQLTNWTKLEREIKIILGLVGLLVKKNSTQEIDPDEI